MAEEQKTAGTAPTAPPEKWVMLKASDAQAMLNYFAKQPCGDVYGFVTLMLNLKECAPPKPVDPPKLVKKVEKKDEE